MVSPLDVDRVKSLIETLSLRRGSPSSELPKLEVLLGVQDEKSKSIAISTTPNKKCLFILLSFHNYIAYIDLGQKCYFQ